jgi:hypothetical protein
MYFKWRIQQALQLETQGSNYPFCTSPGRDCFCDVTVDSDSSRTEASHIRSQVSDSSFGKVDGILRLSRLLSYFDYVQMHSILERRHEEH